MKKNVKNTVIITGGTKGIGAEISRLFYSEGFSVIIGARKDTGLARNLGKNAYFRETDVKSKNAHEKLAQLAIQKTGRVDAYINCAGFSQWQVLEKITEDFLDEIIDTNLKSIFWGCKAAAAVMKKGGSIINISSLAGKRGSANNSAYNASKFGVNGITQSLAKELGPKGIRVNAVCPVYVKTEAVIKALKYEHSPAGGKDVEDYLKSFAEKSSALGRLPTAKEVAEVCFFLASSRASAVTGQCINVDCGVLPQ